MLERRKASQAPRAQKPQKRRKRGLARRRGQCVDNIVVTGDLQVRRGNQLVFHARQAHDHTTIAHKGSVIGAAVLAGERKHASTGLENLVAMGHVALVLDIDDSQIALVHILEQADLRFGIVFVRTVPCQMVVRDIEQNATRGWSSFVVAI